MRYEWRGRGVPGWEEKVRGGVRRREGTVAVRVEERVPYVPRGGRGACRRADAVHAESGCRALPRSGRSACHGGLRAMEGFLHAERTVGVVAERCSPQFVPRAPALLPNQPSASGPALLPNPTAGIRTRPITGVPPRRLHRPTSPPHPTPSLPATSSIRPTSPHRQSARSPAHHPAHLRSDEPASPDRHSARPSPPRSARPARPTHPAQEPGRDSTPRLPGDHPFVSAGP